MKHLLGLEDLSKEEILQLLEKGNGFRQWLDCEYLSTRTALSDLKGRKICLLFYEPSTRTRHSFEIAGRLLGADVSSFTIAVSSVQKGESFKDTLLTLESMGFELFVIRHSSSGACLYASSHLKRAKVVNAGDGMHEHPTQTLLDLLTIFREKGKVEGMKIAIVGDILHSRVARSAIHAFSKLNWDIRLCAPPTLLPAKIEKFPVKLFYNLEDAIKGVDVIYMLRIQRERQKEQFFPSIEEYSRLFGLTHLHKSLAPHAMIMHPGPVNRGVEMEGAVVDCEDSFILEQVRNGVAIRMAVLHSLLGEEEWTC
ncbi:aspartate carbamoyltransferase catalytic subunit [bacterium]|nr:aspartate carbamoyltransferase catalytic subunit [bacterium]